MLRLAARHADIVGLLPARSATRTAPRIPGTGCRRRSTPSWPCSGRPPGTGSPALELNALATFIITGRRRAETEDLIARGWSGIDADAVWQMPTIFIGTADQIRADLQARRERFGLSYLVAGQDCMPALTTIISGL